MDIILVGQRRHIRKEITLTVFTASCYKLYFNSYLQVVYNISVSQAGYISSIFTIVSCACGPLFGL